MKLKLVSFFCVNQKRARVFGAFSKTRVGTFFIGLLVAATVINCGIGGGGGGGSDNRSKGAKITLEQGTFTDREIEKKSGSKFRIEGCPQYVCVWGYGSSVGKTDTVEVKFFTTFDTPPGTYEVKFVAYEGGTECDFIFGCVTKPEKILKTWQALLEVIEAESTFEKSSTYQALNAPQSVKAVDVNRDGRLDLVVLSHIYGSQGPTGSISVFITAKDGSLEPEVVVTETETQASDFALFDVNGDGVLDLVLTFAGSREIPARITIFEGISATDFLPGVSHDINFGESFISYAAYPHYIDTDRDGYEDLVFAVFGGAGSGAIIMRESDGRYYPVRYFGTSEASDGTFPTAFNIVDMDADGLLDLVFVTNSGRTLEISSGVAGDALFSSPTTYDVSGYLAGMGDLNNDSIIDLIISKGREIEVQLGRGNGLFDPSARIDLGRLSRKILLADINSDGLQDILAVSTDGTPNPGVFSPNLSGTSYLIGDGLGGFSAPVANRAPFVITDAAVADFNADGFTDFVIASNPYYQLILYNNLNIF